MVLERHGGWKFQAIKDMTYMDQIIQETQRLYPAVALMMRECTVPYTIPNTNIVIEKGTVITILISSIQRDPKYYPFPEIYDPDRFANNSFKPNPTYMPFGDGPRICIGMRFAILEVKVCLAKIFAGYLVETNSKTKEPITFDRKAFIPRPVGGIWDNFKKDTQKIT